MHPSTSSSPSTSQGKGEEKKSIWSKIFSSKNQDPQEKGMYLQDLASQEIDPEIYALYLGKGQRLTSIWQSIYAAITPSCKSPSGKNPVTQ